VYETGQTGRSNPKYIARALVEHVAYNKLCSEDTGLSRVVANFACISVATLVPAARFQAS